ncbi:MAG: hypothetical protein CVU60_09870 [Deltaproteobacteria bacterium HGW-Deltaproteobacteria-18]|jgi:rhodanese-related sulfurtransferase|nr:MAG: hypothetical protein CVU60_09870 [Deltaproteobacteria bacterium HGW-Deltaproteobacteria-18]
MKPSISFGIRTAIILAISIGLALAFNATRPDRLPLVHDPEIAAQAAAQRGEISLADAILLFESGEAVFADARDAGEYALGHIDGALSLDPLMFEQDFPSLQEQLEGATTIVTYCDGEFCELSRELAEQLKGMGLQNVRVLKNGWTLWRDQGLPTATGSPAPEQAPTTPMSEEKTPPIEQSNGTTTTEPPLTPELPEPATSEQPLEPAMPDQAPEDAEPAPLDQLQERVPQDLPSLTPAPPEPAPAETTPEEPTNQSPPLDSTTQGEKS